MLPALLTLAVAALTTRAELPAPDNILYGAITLNGQVITALSNQVSIEARRTTNGPAIASYRMGAQAVATNFYVLRLPLEELAQVAAPNASLVGDTVYLVIKVGLLDGPLLAYTFPESGVAQRLDFGIASADSDNDGLPDAWELAKFGNLSAGPGTLAANGRTAWQNFIAGADPVSTNGLFTLSISTNNNLKVVSFFGRKAEGAGYTNYTRSYLLESATNLSSANWHGVPGFTNILGNNQTVEYTIPTTNLSFFRGQVRLTTP